ncbi:MAG: ABC transporter ATP-binding protein [Acidobacteria bacterium]|nr:ABC transporter ATP-binding protein [Acidobacteriota bacterium]
MSAAIISVENLSKCYRIKHQPRERYTALRDVLAGKVRNLFLRRAEVSGAAAMEEDFWALQNVSFEIKRGESVGIIGLNGAGKSTLLKILSRITEPTRGRIQMDGRVASLLEVGTGFHPELTGRENIFLNGAILGMRRAEIKRKFDEIVAFAEVERFLDTPVKRYSSGMYVRLAFSVAAHMEPEILIVDEVLAVGDAAFQKRCLGKMHEVAEEEGRTILFVSHNIAAIRSLCRKGLCLNKGRVEAWGPIEAAVEHYLCTFLNRAANGVIPDSLPRQYFTSEARLRRVQLADNAGKAVMTVLTGEGLRVLVEWEVFEAINAMIEVGITDADGRQITQSFSSDGGMPAMRLNPGRYQVELRIYNTIFPGRYFLLAGIHKLDGTTIDFVERVFDFEILNTGKDDPNHYSWTVRGYLRPTQKWGKPIAIPSVSTDTF